jgi:hypothetical protein
MIYIQQDTMMLCRCKILLQAPYAHLPIYQLSPAITQRQLTQ